MDYHISTSWAWAIGIAILWDLVWRGIALWKSSRRDQGPWFVVLLIVNSLGILPIIYLLIYRGRPDVAADRVS